MRGRTSARVAAASMALLFIGLYVFGMIRSQHVADDALKLVSARASEGKLARVPAIWSVDLAPDTRFVAFTPAHGRMFNPVRMERMFSATVTDSDTPIMEGAHVVFWVRWTVDGWVFSRVSPDSPDSDAGAPNKGIEQNARM